MLGPWLMTGFKRPNELLGFKDVMIPMCATPTMFYLFGILPWYASIIAATMMMTLVGQALIPRKGAKVKANPILHTFYISMLFYTYYVLMATVRSLSLTLAVASVQLTCCIYVSDWNVWNESNSFGVLRVHNRGDGDLLRPHKLHRSWCHYAQ